MRWMVLVTLLLVPVAIVGARQLRRSMAEHRAREVTGITWPSDSELLGFSSDTWFKSDHCEVRVRIAPKAREDFLAVHPKLQRGGCRANSPSAFWGGPVSQEAFCDEGSVLHEDASTSWRVTFDPESGELVERVDGFY